MGLGWTLQPQPPCHLTQGHLSTVAVKKYLSLPPLCTLLGNTWGWQPGRCGPPSPITPLVAQWQPPPPPPVPPPEPGAPGTHKRRAGTGRTQRVQ